MEFDIPTSLERRALVFIASNIIVKNGGGCKSGLHVDNGIWFMTTSKDCASVASATIKKLPLPGHMQMKLRCFVNGMWDELVTWIRTICYENFIEYVSISGVTSGCICRYIRNVQWAPNGTVDQVKSCEALVQDENLNVMDRFALACRGCLVKHMHHLWQKINRSLLKGRLLETARIDYNRDVLVLYWTHTLERTMSEFQDRVGQRPTTLAFVSSSTSGNFLATKYFLPTLTSEEKKTLLKFTATKAATGSPEIFRFLIANVSEDVRESIFSECAYSLLMNFTYWPYKECFVSIYHQLSKFLVNTDYNFLLCEIHRKITMDPRQDLMGHTELFGTFWEVLPLSGKQYMIDLWTAVPSLKKDWEYCSDKEDAFEIEVEELKQLVSNDMTDSQRREFEVRLRVVDFRDRLDLYNDCEAGQHETTQSPESAMFLLASRREFLALRKEFLSILIEGEIGCEKREEYLKMFDNCIIISSADEEEFHSP